MRYDTLAGAVFAASPLVQRESYWTAGFGIRMDDRQIRSHLVEVTELGTVPMTASLKDRPTSISRSTASLTLLGLICLAWSVIRAPAVLHFARRFGTESRQARHHGGLSTLRVVAVADRDLPPRFARHRFPCGRSRR